MIFSTRLSSAAQAPVEYAPHSTGHADYIVIEYLHLVGSFKRYLGRQLREKICVPIFYLKSFPMVSMFFHRDACNAGLLHEPLYLCVPCALCLPRRSGRSYWGEINEILVRHTNKTKKRRGRSAPPHGQCHRSLPSQDGGLFRGLWKIQKGHKIPVSQLPLCTF